jgi:hypothetical protein
MLKSFLIVAAFAFNAQDALAQQAETVVPSSRPPSEVVVEYVGAQPAPANPVQLTETVSVGDTVPDNLVLSPVPDSPEYSFLFVNQQRLIVDTRTRSILWILK